MSVRGGVARARECLHVAVACMDASAMSAIHYCTTPGCFSATTKGTLLCARHHAAATSAAHDARTMPGNSHAVRRTAGSFIAKVCSSCSREDAAAGKVMCVACIAKYARCGAVNSVSFDARQQHASSDDVDAPEVQAEVQAAEPAVPPPPTHVVTTTTFTVAGKPIEVDIDELCAGIRYQEDEHESENQRLHNIDQAKAKQPGTSNAASVASTSAAKAGEGTPATLMTTMNHGSQFMAAHMSKLITQRQAAPNTKAKARVGFALVKGTNRKKVKGKEKVPAGCVWHGFNDNSSYLKLACGKCKKKYTTVPSKLAQLEFCDTNVCKGQASCLQAGQVSQRLQARLVHTGTFFDAHTLACNVANVVQTHVFDAHTHAA